MRGGEMAKLREIPFALYYGSVDSTPLFVLLAGLYWKRTGDDETIRALWPAIEAALAWIDGPGDADGDGFVEYYRMTETGLSNQGWKDSFDAIFHADGRLAEGPIALAEVQGYVYAAKKVAACCAERIGKPERARMLDVEADDLARRFDASFWCPELGMYALALDGAKTPTPSRSMEPRPPAACAARMPARSCSRASRGPNGPPRLPTICCGRNSFPDGASERSPRARRSITRCPTTTARYGRTTMR
jgi:glycogen debranching enzyme